AWRREGNRFAVGGPKRIASIFGPWEQTGGGAIERPYPESWLAIDSGDVGGGLAIGRQRKPPTPAPNPTNSPPSGGVSWIRNAPSWAVGCRRRRRCVGSRRGLRAWSRTRWRSAHFERSTRRATRVPWADTSQRRCLDRCLCLSR